MKKILLLAGVVYAQKKVPQNCLYCKNMDMEADFMYSYSYCPSSDECVADQWNKFNAWCNEPWVDGYKLDIEQDCLSEKVEPCITFTSSAIAEGQDISASKTLNAGEVCEVFIDASTYVAHVKFQAKGSSIDNDVGILYNGVGPGDIIEVKEGQTVRISIFNAAPDGDSMQFEYFFSGAIRASVASAVAMTGIVYYLV